MALYLFDAYAWIEYFEGSSQGAKVNELLLDADNTILTAESTISELCLWTLKRNKNFPLMLDMVRKRSTIVNIYMNIWVEATYLKFALRKKRKKIGILDTLLLAIQKTNDAVIVTGDSVFIGSKNILML